MNRPEKAVPISRATEGIGVGDASSSTPTFITSSSCVHVRVYIPLVGPEIVYESDAVPAYSK